MWTSRPYLFLLHRPIAQTLMQHPGGPSGVPLGRSMRCNLSRNISIMDVPPCEKHKCIGTNMFCKVDELEGHQNKHGKNWLLRLASESTLAIMALASIAAPKFDAHAPWDFSCLASSTLFLSSCWRSFDRLWSSGSSATSSWILASDKRSPALCP